MDKKRQVHRLPQHGSQNKVMSTVADLKIVQEENSLSIRGKVKKAFTEKSTS